MKAWAQGAWSARDRWGQPWLANRVVDLAARMLARLPEERAFPATPETSPATRGLGLLYPLGGEHPHRFHVKST
jgi:hypothetical protein